MKELNVKRIEWIDVCKGLGIFLVFIGHTNVSQLSRTLYDWIYSFHMPLFYMLSGLVFDKTKYNTFRKYINRRFKTLILPFFILNTILYIIAEVLNLDNVQPQATELLTGVLAMYFIRVLFISEVWYYFINQIGNKPFYKLVLIAVVIYISSFFKESSVLLRYILPGLPLLYYGIGNIFKDSIKACVNNATARRLVLCFMLSVLFSLILLPYRKFTVFMDIILALSGILSLISVGVLLQRANFFSFVKVKTYIVFIGMNTLIVVAFHQIIYNGLSVFTKYFHMLPLWDGLIRILLVLLFLIILCRIVRKYAPFVIGR